MNQNVEFLFTAERALMTADAAGLMNDTDISLAMTYRDFQSKTFTPSTGQTTPTYTDSAVQGIQNAIPAREVEASNGLYQMGDIRLTFARSQLTIIPNKEDLIVLDGQSY